MPAVWEAQKSKVKKQNNRNIVAKPGKNTRQANHLAGKDGLMVCEYAALTILEFLIFFLNFFCFAFSPAHCNNGVAITIFTALHCNIFAFFTRFLVFAICFLVCSFVFLVVKLSFSGVTNVIRKFRKSVVYHLNVILLRLNH